MIWCAGREGTCARLTWDDTNRFITMGNPRDQKTHLKGVFQGINCLTLLTQVWETFRMAIKGLVEKKKLCQEHGWNISEGVTSRKVSLSKSRVHECPWADKVTVIELATPTLPPALSWCVWLCAWVGVSSHDLGFSPGPGVLYNTTQVPLSGIIVELNKPTHLTLVCAFITQNTAESSDSLRVNESPKLSTLTVKINICLFKVLTALWVCLVFA